MENRNVVILRHAVRVIAGLGVIASLVMGINSVVPAIGYALELDFERANQHILIGFLYALMSWLSWYLFEKAGRSTRERRC